MRRLPSLNAVKAFEAAARGKSFTRAAEELFVTPGAVSRQVKVLEAELGLKLFNRERQRLVITAAGREYLAVVREALDQIALGTERLMQRQRSGVLTVRVGPDFAAKWLVNRLGRFVENHPEIDLRVSAGDQRVDFAREEVDLAVRHGDGQWPELDVVRLCHERLFPVCSPKLFRGRNRVTSASDLLKFPLLRLEDWTNWGRLFEAAGVDAPAMAGPVLNRASLLIDAAIDGQGIALARTALAAWDLIHGRLMKPIDVSAVGSQDLLDHLPKGDRQRSEDRYVSTMVVGRSRRRCAPAGFSVSHPLFHSKNTELEEVPLTGSLQSPNLPRLRRCAIISAAVAASPDGRLASVSTAPHRPSIAVSQAVWARYLR